MNEGPEPNQISRDLEEFFTFLLRQGADVSDLVRSYLRYHGVLNFGHSTAIYNEVVRRISIDDPERGASLPRHAVIGDSGDLTQALLQEYASDLIDAYYQPANIDEFQTTRIIEGGPNEWAWQGIPEPYRMRIGLARRPHFDLFTAHGNELFVSQYGYQYFNHDQNIYWPAASSRAFALIKGTYPERQVAHSVVMLQDLHDIGNFSHFLYDAIPRLLYYVDMFPQKKNSTLFVFGGERGPFQNFILDIVSERLGIDQKNFIFPVKREIWHLKKDFHFFSDQRVSLMHPLTMCHPTTLRIVRGLLGEDLFSRDNPKKIYLSRAASDMRRLRNDEEITNELAKVGHVRIDMAKLTIREQMSLLVGARSVVAVHGMALTGMIFNREISRVVEIFSPVIGSDTYAFPLRALGIDYAFSIGHNSIDNDNLSFEADKDLIAAMASMKSYQNPD